MRFEGALLAWLALPAFGGFFQNTLGIARLDDCYNLPIIGSRAGGSLNPLKPYWMVTHDRLESAPVNDDSYNVVATVIERNNQGSTKDTLVIHPATIASFLNTSSLNADRNGHTATLLPNGKVLVTGGYGNSGWLSSAELYDPTTGTFQPTWSNAWPNTPTSNAGRPCLSVSAVTPGQPN